MTNDTRPIPALASDPAPGVDTPDPGLPVDPDTPLDTGEPVDPLPPPVNAAAVDPLSPEEARREAQSALMVGGSMVGAAAGAGLGAMVAGPVGIVVGASIGYATGALSAAAATGAAQAATSEDTRPDGELDRLLHPEAGSTPDRPDALEVLDTTRGPADPKLRADQAAAEAVADEVETLRRRQAAH